MTDYDIQGNYGYGHGYETVDCVTGMPEAKAAIKVYRENEPGIPFRIRAAKNMSRALRESK